MDIRPLLGINFSDFNDLLNHYVKYNFNMSDEAIDKIILNVEKIYNNTKFIMNSLFYNLNKNEKYYNEKMYSVDYNFDEKTAFHIIKKIYESNNIKTKKIIKKIIKEYIRPKILKYLLYIKKIIILFPKYKDLINTFSAR